MLGSFGQLQGEGVARLRQGAHRFRVRFAKADERCVGGPREGVEGERLRYRSDGHGVRQKSLGNEV